MRCRCPLRSVRDRANANLVWAVPVGEGELEYEELFVVCKGECDHALEAKLHARGYTSAWEEVDDLFNPLLFLKNMLTYMNMLRENPRRYSDKGHKRMKEYTLRSPAHSTKVTREDLERFKDLRILDYLRI